MRANPERTCWRKALGQEVGVSDQADRNSDLVEVVKRNGEFRKWGPFWGPLLYWLSMRAARPRSFWWKGLLGVGTVIAVVLWRSGIIPVG